MFLGSISSAGTGTLIELFKCKKDMDYLVLLNRTLVRPPRERDLLIWTIIKIFKSWKTNHVYTDSRW